MSLDVPAAVRQYLSGAASELHEGDIQRLRISPLLLTTSAENLLERRRPLFVSLTWQKAPYGFRVSFSRRFRRTRAEPKGRIISGEFDILVLSTQAVLVCSKLERDENEYGPLLLARKAYPVGKRPFIHSRKMARLLNHLAEIQQWNLICTKAMGYDRDTGRSRSDYKRQTIDDAVAEMREQGRNTHRLRVSFSKRNRHEALRATFDRYGSAVLVKGPPAIAVVRYCIPSMEQTLKEAPEYNVTRQPDSLSQHMLQLTFDGEPFADIKGMVSLCDAVKAGSGLSLAVVHLNPYLHAQILDFYTGAAVELVIMDHSRASLIPRTVGGGPSLERITATIFRHFGEGAVKQDALLTPEERSAHH